MSLQTLRRNCTFDEAGLNSEILPGKFFAILPDFSLDYRASFASENRIWDRNYSAHDVGCFEAANVAREDLEVGVVFAEALPLLAQARVSVAYFRKVVHFWKLRKKLTFFQIKIRKQFCFLIAKMRTGWILIYFLDVCFAYLKPCPPPPCAWYKICGIAKKR